MSFIRDVLACVECPICLGTMEEPVAPTCGHTFCRSCIGALVGRSDACPVCRGNLTIEGLRHIRCASHLCHVLPQLLEALLQSEDLIAALRDDVAHAEQKCADLEIRYAALQWDAQCVAQKCLDAEPLAEYRAEAVHAEDCESSACLHKL